MCANIDNNKTFLFRYNLMNGNLDLPGYNVFNKAIGSEYTELTDKMFQAMWNAYLLNKGGIALPYWSSKFDNPEVFNRVLMSLCKSGWVESHSIPAKNWAEAFISEAKLLTIVTPTDLVTIRANNKFRKYLITDATPTTTNRVRRNGKTTRTGLVRNGFNLAGNTIFTYDKDMMIEYYDVIVKQLVKGMDKVRGLLKDLGRELRTDSASYDEVSKDLLDFYIHSNDTYRLGENISDSRGRAIYQILKKVFNPISNKEARSLLVIPEEFRLATTKDTIDNYFLFIAEIHGFKAGTVEEKIETGRQKFLANALLDLDIVSKAVAIRADSKLTRDEMYKALAEDAKRVEDNQKLVYENIWLERMYKELNEYFANPKGYKFSVPVEVDASASVLQYLGLLLNHKPFMEKTNLIGTDLSDPWTIKGINSRAQVKVIMRTIYGSSQQCWQMWQDEGISYTKEDIVRYNNELKHGSLAIAEKFKNFLINNCKPKEKMVINLWNDTFEIECNRFKHIGEKTIAYDIYDSVDHKIKRVTNTTTKKVADLDQFRRYFITLLI